MKILVSCPESLFRRARFLIVLFIWWIGAFPVSAQTIDLGNSLSQAGKYRDAIRAYELFMEQNPGRTYDHSVALLGISYNFLQLGDTEEAIAANDRSIAIREKLRSDDKAENYMRYGIIDLYRGRFETALENLAQARSLPSVDPVQFALLEELMADAYAGLNNPREAARHYMLWVESLSAEMDKGHPEVVAALHKLGRFYLSQGRISDAKDELLIALSAEERSGRKGSQTIQILNSLGELAWRESGHRAARSFFLRALTVLESNSESRREDAAMTHMNLCRAALAGAELQEAAIHAQRALQALYPGSSPEAIAAGASIPVPDRIMAAQAYSMKARYLTALNSPDSTAAALNCYAAAIALLEEESVTGGSFTDATKLIEGISSILEDAVAAAMDTGKPNDVRLAFEWVERSKVILLRAEFLLPALPGHALAAEEKRLRRELREAERDFRLNPEDMAKAREASIRKAAFFQFSEQLRTIAPHYFYTRLARPQTLTAEIQALLDDETVLLSFFSGRERHFVFALTRKECTANPMPLDDAGPKAAVEGYLRAIDQEDAEAFLLHASNLYRMLIEPVKSALTGKTRLVIIPNAGMTLFPIEALLTAPVKGKAGKVQYSKLPYLAKAYMVHYHLAAPFWAIPAGAISHAQAGIGFAQGEVTATQPAPKTKATQIFLESGKSGVLISAQPHPGKSLRGGLQADVARMLSTGIPPARALAEAKRARIKDKNSSAPFHWISPILIGQ